MLQNPGIEDGEQTDLLALGFEIQNHPLCVLHGFAHPAKTIGTFGLHRPHGCDVLLCQGVQLQFCKRTVRNHWSTTLKLINCLLWAHVAGQQCISQRFHVRRSDGEERQAAIARLNLHQQRVGIGFRALANQLGQRFHGRTAEEDGQGDLPPSNFLDFREQTRGEQGVTAQIEEVVVYA